MIRVDVSNRFILNPQDNAKLDKCINAYSKDLGISNLISRIWNAIRSIFDRSDWQQARKMLEGRTLTAVRDDFSVANTPDSVLKSRAHALSEFILKYLVTAESIRIQHHQIYLTPAQMQDTNEELFERATYGGLSPRDSLRNKIRDEKTAFAQDIDRFENYLKTDPRYEAPSALASTIIANISLSKPKENHLLTLTNSVVTQAKKNLDLAQKQFRQWNSISMTNLHLNILIGQRSTFNKTTAPLMKK